MKLKISFIAGLFAMAAQFSFSQQAVIIDDVFTITEQYNGFRYFNPNPASGMDWTKPYDFYNGTFEFRYEIMEYSADTSMILMVCIWAEIKGNWESWKETCSPMIHIPGTGVFTASSSPSKWWTLNDVPVNFSRVDLMKQLGMVVWCDNLHIMSSLPKPEKSCWEKHKRYLPFKVRLTVVAVAKGHKFSGWEHFLKSTPAKSQEPRAKNQEPRTKT